MIGSDETGARVAGHNAWHWVFQTPDASYHVIVPRRNADVIAAFLGDARPESWVSDLWSPQIQVDADTSSATPVKTVMVCGIAALLCAGPRFRRGTVGPVGRN